MGSKISKQKQMFSLLNYKFPNLLEQSLDHTIASELEKEDQFSTQYSPQLINKVYTRIDGILQSKFTFLETGDLWEYRESGNIADML